MIKVVIIKTKDGAEKIVFIPYSLQNEEIRSHLIRNGKIVGDDKIISIKS